MTGTPLAGIVAELEDLVTDSVTPGYAFCMRRNGDVTYRYGGRLDQSPSSPCPTSDTVYDVASLTKVLATWGTVGRLIALGHVRLDDPVTTFFPDCNPAVGAHTIADLLLHRTTLPPSTWLAQYGEDRASIERGVLSAATEPRSSTPALYLNRGYIVLGWIIERVAARPLHEVVAAEWWRPLGMLHTYFNPLSEGVTPLECAPTEREQGDRPALRGIVHDENARHLGGTAGHAGAFSTLADLVRFMTLMLDSPGVLALQPGYLTASVDPLVPWMDKRARAFGWWVSDEGSLVRHDGFTGTTMCFAPATGNFAVLLTNAVYYGRRSPRIGRARDVLSQAVVSA
jgi:CubicO group peptidase (beta-lactamase class C family)